ncbi:hypothetical protein LBMAG56_48960 [Verrucomicrobiota bacterium]|nr:hypothetical protein LBMAG56_48960 [Verrucomicrobiota bacterium]
MSRDYELKPFRSQVELHIDYARELNPQQHAAVTAVPGPALVIAGAGSGKTRTLTYRVAYLIEQGIPPDRILLLTFTNKAAREMMRRVADLLGAELQSLWGGTFHSIGARILRRHTDQLGFRPDFTILDREDATALLKACLAEAEIDIKATRFPKADVVGDICSLALNTNRSVAEVVADAYPYFVQLTPQIEDVGRRYTARKRTANVMDFDDLLALWLKLLREHADVREQYQRKFQFILVDEYQDTNKLQSELIDLLAARHKNVMVVGDDSQSIYAWRGAHFKNILQFPQRYPGAQTYKIEVNYRSTPEILAVANAAIAANVEQFAKQLAPARKSGMKPVLVPCGDSREQAAFVAQRILELREEGVNLNQQAVLYRSHFHAFDLQLELTRRNIPFSITSGIRFFEQAHIKDLTAYLRLVCNPTDELAFKRIVQLMPGIGGGAAAKLWDLFSSHRPPLTPAAPVPDPEPSEPSEMPTVSDLKSSNLKSQIPAPSPAPDLKSQILKSQISDPAAPIATALQKCAAKVPKKAATAWAQFTPTIAQLEAEPVRHQPAAMIQLVLEAGYEDYLQETYPNFRNRLEDLEQLAAFALQFTGPEDFLAQLALLTNIEADDDAAKRNDQEQVRLSSIHQAKGLEFDVVFIIMLCDGLFPSARSLETIDGQEEERRLFYVAVTRARNELYLSFPLVRMTPGSYGGDAMQQPSRFLGEIPKDLLDEWNLRSFHSYE